MSSSSALLPPSDPHARFFATDHLRKDLKRRSVRGGATTASAQAIQFIIRFGSTAVLARLLTPEKMPNPNVELDDLPSTVMEASTGAISVDGYQQPAVTVERKPRRQLTPDQRRQRTEQLRRMAKGRKRTLQSDGEGGRVPGVQSAPV